MNELTFYLNQGIRHILDPEGLDHLYFIISFSLLYSFKNWKKALGLITAFTIGHSTTLLLAALNIFTLSPSIVETLIPITILISCLNNYWHLYKDSVSKQSLLSTYVILLFFGLIHGLGFSYFLKAMLFEGDSIVLPLLGFNLGIEIAQIIIVLGFLLLVSLLLLTPIKRKYLLIGINSVIFVLVGLMLVG